MRLNQLLISAALLQSSVSFAAATFPITIDNQTNIATDENVYVAIKAIIDDKDCMMAFDNSGNGTCEIVNKESDLSKYNYSLASIPHQLNLPQTASGRVYFSVGYPVRLHVDPNTDKIVDPDGFNPRDTNYYTLYDKIEYTFNDNGTWMNPTAVDFFSIPIRITQEGSTSSVKEAGYSSSREQVLDKVSQTFEQYDATSDKHWNKLKLNFNNTLLRLMAPGKAMVEIPNTNPFPLTYLADADSTGFNYTDYLWDYYRTAKLTVDCSELESQVALNDYQFTGHVEGDNFVFKNKDGSSVVSIAKPNNSRPFFAGAGDSFDAENNTPKAIIIREFTSAFEAGLLPAENGTVLNKTFFEQAKPNYYTRNALVADNGGPWYDLYSKALHSLGESQPIYTFAYDDALGQDGTLHDPSGTAPSVAKITLGDMSNTTIPNPYADSTTYQITPIIGKDSQVIYKGKALESNQVLNNVTIPFHVTLNGNEMDIYINPQMVIPFSQQSDGIVIDKTASTQATVIFPSAPKQ